MLKLRLERRRLRRCNLFEVGAVYDKDVDLSLLKLEVSTLTHWIIPQLNMNFTIYRFSSTAAFLPCCNFYRSVIGLKSGIDKIVKGFYKLADAILYLYS